LFDRLDNDFERNFVGRQDRPPAAFIRHTGNQVAPLFENLLSGPMHLSNRMQGVRIKLEAVRDHQEILDFDVVRSVKPSGKHIHHRHRNGGSSRAREHFIEGLP
jgi:hypothetical protein